MKDIKHIKPGTSIYFFLIRLDNLIVFIRSHNELCYNLLPSFVKEGPVELLFDKRKSHLKGSSRYRRYFIFVGNYPARFNRDIPI